MAIRKLRHRVAGGSRGIFDCFFRSVSGNAVPPRETREAVITQRVLSLEQFAQENRCQSSKAWREPKDDHSIKI